MTRIVRATPARQRQRPPSGPAAGSDVHYINVDMIMRMWQHPNPRDRDNPFTMIELTGGRGITSYIEPPEHFWPELAMSPPEG